MISVVKPWVFGLPFRMQSVLFSALRGCDTAKKHDASKALTRAIRGLLLNNADPSNTFISETGEVDPKKLDEFLWDLDAYPMHFIMHTAHAAEIIGFKHPDPKVQEYWKRVYFAVVKGLHLNPETQAQLDVRLGTTPAEQVVREAEAERTIVRPVSEYIQRLDARNDALQARLQANSGSQDASGHVWDAGTGTSHGPPTRNPSNGGS